jgi:hypothetical protein
LPANEIKQDELQTRGIQLRLKQRKRRKNFMRASNSAKDVTTQKQSTHKIKNNNCQAHAHEK